MKTVEGTRRDEDMSGKMTEPENVQKGTRSTKFVRSWKVGFLTTESEGGAAVLVEQEEDDTIPRKISYE